MKEIGFGIAIGLGIKGLGDLNTTNNAMKTLKSLAKQTDEGFKGLSRTLAQYKLNLKEINALTERQSQLKSQLFNMKNLIMGGAIALPLKVAIDFEAAMADVAKVVDFTDKAEEKLFADSIQRMTRIIPKTAEELASIMAAGGATGIAKENLEQFTEMVAKAAFAFDMQADEAGRSMAVIMNVFGLGVDAGGELADAINKVSNTVGVKGGDIIETMGRIGGNAKTFGIAAKDAAALSGALISLGRSPQIAATSINTLFNKLQTADMQGKDFQDALKAIGTDAVKLKDAIQKNPQKALDDFLARLAKADKEKQPKIFTQIMGEGFSDDLSLLVGALGQYDKALGSVAEKGNYAGSMQLEFAKKAETTAAKMQFLKNSINENANSIGQLFLPALASVINTITGAIYSINSFIKEHETLTKVILGVVGGFILLKTAVIAVLLVKTSLQLLSLKYWNSLIFGQIGIKAFTKSLFTKAAALKTTALATSTSAAATSFLGKAFMGTAGFFKIGAKVIGMAIRGIPIIGWIAMAIEAIIWLSGKFGGFGNLVKWVWDKIKTVLSYSPFGLIVKVWGAVFNWLGEKFEWVGSMIEWVTDIFNQAIDKIKGFFKDVSDFFFGDDEEETEVNKTVNQANETIQEAGSYPVYAAQAVSTSGAAVIINMNGNMTIGIDKNGKFDFNEFKEQLVQAVKESMKQEQKNAYNSRLGR